MKKLPMVFGFALVSTLGSLAFAHGGGGKFKKADTNGDGKVSLAEALDSAKKHFQAKDANKDGMLTKDEVQGRMQRMFEKADTNKDGKITTAELEASVREHFAKRDANKDGFLSGDELRHGKWGKKRGQEKS